MPFFYWLRIGYLDYKDYSEIMTKCMHNRVATFKRTGFDIDGKEIVFASK